jgi:ubiquinone/menaquinone biosynthesis C-methylase UbiE
MSRLDEPSDGVIRLYPRLVPDRSAPTLSLGCPVAYGASAVRKRLSAFARHWPLSGERLLDIGCGNGAYTTALGAGFEEVYGVDVEPVRVADFRRHVDGDPKFRISVASAEALPLPDDHFDVVTAIEVIEHIVDLERAMGEIHRVLRPGGGFLVSCPNRLFPIETHTFTVGKHEYSARGCLFLPYLTGLHGRISTARNFTTRELTELATGAGYRVVAYDWVMPPLDNWRPGKQSLRRLLNAMERSPLRVFGVSIIGVFTKDPSGMTTPVGP